MIDFIDIAAIPICSLLMRIKGGGPTPYREWFRKHVSFLDGALDGKIISPIGFALLCLFCVPWWQAIIAGFGWLAAVAPSIGEDIAEVRQLNFKPGVIRGGYLGAMIALALWNPAFIVSGLTFPLCYLAAHYIKPEDWKYGEYLLGALLGVAFLFQ
jgi:hypothetical protein